MKNKHTYIYIVCLALLLLSSATQVHAQVMSDYTAYPPFVTNAVTPNILLVLDESGSMQFPAFQDCTFAGYSAKRAVCGSSDSVQNPARSYDPSHDYYGYFKNDKYYNYNANKFDENAACDADPTVTPRVGNNAGCISGNLLNWATMSRIDLLRKALLGGKSVSQQGNAHTLRGEGAWWTYSDEALGCTFNLSGGTYPQLDHVISISDYSSGILTVSASGSQIIGTTDSFRYIYQSINGDFDVKLRVVTPPYETGQTYAKAGLMVRAGITADSQHVKAMATYGAGLQFSERLVDGGNTNIVGNYISINYPVWVRIVRTGNTFSYYYSSNGTAWTLQGTSVVAMPANVFVGMASASYNNGMLGTAKYDDFVCSGCSSDNFNDALFNGGIWTAVDISTGVPGSESESPNTCAVGTIANANVKVDLPENERRGVIQNISDKDYDGNFDADAPRFGLMVYAGDSRYGCMRAGIDGSNMSSLINALQSEPPYHGTPTGEAFDEAWDYYAQSNAHNNCNNNPYIGGVGSNKDPWCDSGNPVSCRKSYILHISDGEWNRAVDPVVPARQTHVTDIRPDMDGTQSLSYYNVYIFNDTAAGANAMQQSSMYGAFDDYDGNKWPYDRSGYPADSRTATLPAAPCDPAALPMNGNCKEWDKNHDGLPDTYFEATDGDKLESALIKAITDILKRASSGTAVSVLATTGEGEGAVYQAFFFPQKLENLEDRKWLGQIHSLFVDKYGNLREDTNANKALDLASDFIVSMDYDPDLGSIVNKFSDANGDGVKDSGTPSETVPLESLNPIWNGGTALWQRAPGSRTIFTTLNGFSTLAFSTGNAGTLEPWVRAADITEAQNIIQWVRGDDLVGVTDANHPFGYRERSVTINSMTNVWKLGDIIYSTPTIVSRPMENYDLLYGDAGYTEFRNKHLNRRQVVYVGANDGMLHAFNAGCFDESTQQYYTDVDVSGNCISGGHSLGEELWAFIPKDLLPHLKWNTDPDYTHVYYVDLKPKITDIKMFTADAEHSQGWGTILIGGLRYGGKDISWASGGTNYSASPEYFALDITDPLNPRLLWTFSSPDLGLSMTYPSIAKIGDNWYVLVGSGATDYDEGSNLTNFQAGNIFVLKISSGINGVIDAWTEGGNFWKIPTGNASSFLADSITVDVDIDFSADVAYVGENYKQGGNWNALMHRITTNHGSQSDPSQWILSTMANVDTISGTKDDIKRITAAPSAAMDDRANVWIYFGTGQFLGTLDKNQTDTGGFYAMKDGCWMGACGNSYSNLLDVSAASVNTDGTVSGVSGSCSGSATSWSGLLSASYACEGWAVYFKNLGEAVDFSGAVLQHNGERVVSKPIAIGGLVLWATYIPGIDKCSYEGESNVYAAYYETGTAYKKYVFKEQKDNANPPETVARTKKLGEGMPSSMSAQITAGGTAKGFVQQSTGSIIEIESITPLSLRSRIIGWRDKALE